MGRSRQPEQGERWGGGGFHAGRGPYGSLQRQYESRFVAGGRRGSYGDFRERPGRDGGEMLHGGFSAATGGGYAPGDAPTDPAARRQIPRRRGPKGYVRSDMRIHEELCECLARAAALDVSDVTVSVAGGKVTLGGTVPERRMRHDIEDLVDACPGVEDIENRIRVRR